MQLLWHRLIAGSPRPFRRKPGRLSRRVSASRAVKDWLLRQATFAPGSGAAAALVSGRIGSPTRAVVTASPVAVLVAGRWSWTPTSHSPRGWTTSHGRDR